MFTLILYFALPASQKLRSSRVSKERQENIDLVMDVFVRRKDIPSSTAARLHSVECFKIVLVKNESKHVGIRGKLWLTFNARSSSDDF